MTTSQILAIAAALILGSAIDRFNRHRPRAVVVPAPVEVKGLDRAEMLALIAERPSPWHQYTPPGSLPTNRIP